MSDLARRFVGWPSDNIEDIWQHGFRARFYRGGEVLMSAMSGLDIALVCLKPYSTLRPALADSPSLSSCSLQWDIKGKRMGVPVWSLLGGAVRAKLPVYVSPSHLPSSHVGPHLI